MKSIAAHQTTLNALQTSPPIILCLLAAALSAFVTHPQTALAAVRLVTSNCASPCTTATSCHTTFASALAAATQPGDVILVCSGTYFTQFTVSQRHSSLTLKAFGTVTLDGTEAYSDYGQWTQLDESNVWWTTVPADNPTHRDQLFVDDTRYIYVNPPGGGYSGLATGTFSYDTTLSLTRLYTNVENGNNPGDQHNTYVSVRPRGIFIDRSDSIIVDGFTVQRTRDKGIDVRGTDSTLNIRYNTVRNCISKYNGNQGILLRNCIDCTIDNNDVFLNGGHGIDLSSDSSCTVTRNESYNNNDPSAPLILGGVAGIKVQSVGEVGRESKAISLDYNVLHHNEDSGIDLKDAEDLFVRRNVSYSNGDHGFDNNATDRTTLLNNLAVDNDHDGISVEKGATNVVVYNNICAYNCVDGTTLSFQENLAELWVGDSTQVTSDHNLLIALSPHGGIPPLTPAWERHLVQWGISEHDTLPSHQSGSEMDGHSRTTDPAFANLAEANFTIDDTSGVVDRGKSDVSGLLSADPRGWEPHDIPTVFNVGGALSFGDVGVYEYDGPPGKVQDLQADIVTSSSVHLHWTTTADDGYTGPTNAVNDMRYLFGSLVTEGNWASATQASGEPAPARADTAQGFTVTGLTSCLWYYFGLKFSDVHGFVSELGDTTRALTPPQYINGQWVCDEGLMAGGGSRARLVSRSGAVGTLSEQTTSNVAGTGQPFALVVWPSESELKVTVVALTPEGVPGYEAGGGGGVLYEVADGDGWKSRLHYDLPAGDSWGLVPPGRPGRWVFREPLAVHAVANELGADGGRWLISESRHSRLGVVTESLSDQIPEMDSGDTLEIRYTRESGDDPSLASVVVVMVKPTGSAVQARPGLQVGDLAGLPAVFALHQNQPNPFGASTHVLFDLPRPEIVRIEMFDLMGRRVAVLRNAWMPAGRHSLEWDGRDSNGAVARPGAYLCRMTAGVIRHQRKVIRLP